MWEGSGAPPKSLTRVGRLFKKYGKGREALPKVQEALGTPLKSPKSVERPS